MRREVLLVEDSDDVRVALVELLELLGHRVEAVSDGLAAVKRACASRPEVVLVDLGIPGIDGLEVARRIRAELGEAPRLVAMTGAARAEDRRLALEAGFDAHLVKPIEVADLEAVLARGR
jgi:two-component system, sensor histidine kinase